MKQPVHLPRPMKRPLRRICILKPSEFQALLNSATPETLPAIVLAGFCGLRTGEILDLDWSDIEPDKKTVFINCNTKLSRSRVAPLPEAAIAWLASIAKDSGPVVNYRSQNDFYRATDPVWKSAGVKRTPNLLRLSMMSYLFAATNNPSRTARELGISPELLERHLPKSISTDDIEAWFSIFPPSA